MPGNHRVELHDTETGCEHGECLECPLPECKYDHADGNPRPVAVSRVAPVVAKARPSVAPAHYEKGKVRQTVARHLRALGWAQQQIARHLGVHQPYVSTLLNKRSYD